MSGGWWFLLSCVFFVASQSTFEDSLAAAVDAYQSGELARAESLLRAAILGPHNNSDTTRHLLWKGEAYLSSVLVDSGRLLEAAEVLEDAVARAPAEVSLWDNLGSCYHRAGATVAAEETYQRWAETPGAPDKDRAWVRLGTLYVQEGKTEDAAGAFLAAVSTNGANVDARMLLATALWELGDHEAAAHNLRVALHYDANYAGVREALDEAESLILLGGGGVNQATSSPTSDETGRLTKLRSMREVFDDYADEYDTHLQGELEYRAPDIVASAALRVAAKFAASSSSVAALPTNGTRRPIATWRTLDLGCGTGLVVQALRSLLSNRTVPGVGGAWWASAKVRGTVLDAGSVFRLGEIIGVDLSPSMLKVAGRRGLYDELIEQDLLAFLRAEASRKDETGPGGREPQTLILAADVCIYMGSLDMLVRQVAEALAGGGGALRVYR